MLAPKAAPTSEGAAKLTVQVMFPCLMQLTAQLFTYSMPLRPMNIFKMFFFFEILARVRHAYRPVESI